MLVIFASNLQFYIEFIFGQNFQLAGNISIKSSVLYVFIVAPNLHLYMFFVFAINFQFYMLFIFGPNFQLFMIVIYESNAALHVDYLCTKYLDLYAGNICF